MSKNLFGNIFGFWLLIAGLEFMAVGSQKAEIIGKINVTGHRTLLIQSFFF